MILLLLAGLLPAQTTQPQTAPPTTVTSGTVLDAQDKPAVGAKIYTLQDQHYVEVLDGQFQRIVKMSQNVNSPEAAIPAAVTTDALGKFPVPNLAINEGLLILHDRGYALRNQAQLKGQSSVKLTAWAGVEGNFRRGSKVMPRTPVIARSGAWIPTSVPNNEENQSMLWARFASQTTTDDQGHFKLEGLASDVATVQDQLPSPRKNLFLDHSTVQVFCMLEAGKIASVQLGGTGRPVVGRLDLPDDFFADPDVFVFITIASARPKNTDESDVTKVIRRSIYVQGVATFRIEDLPAGEYHLWADKCISDDEWSLAKQSFIVAPIPSGQTDEPQDLGLIKLQKVAMLKRGLPVPELKATQLDGKPFDLSEYKGRYVLLDFWATWCGPCVGETQNLKAVYDAYGSDPRLQMVSVSFDKSNEPLKKYIDDKKMTWTHVLLTEAEQKMVRQTWGVDGIPEIDLIGPDGKIVARNLRGPAILQAVQTELKELQKARGDGK
jgi:thiol-disulfide isomerase/thioredoxin